MQLKPGDVICLYLSAFCVLVAAMQIPCSGVTTQKNHTGICLGFDVREAHAKPVTYVSSRSNSQLLDPGRKMTKREKFLEMQKLLFTKYSHWRYEEEVRIWTSLDPATCENGRYFFDFSDDLVLREVIVGARSNATRSQVKRAITGLDGVSICKARLAFNTFRVVKNRNQSMWK